MAVNVLLGPIEVQSVSFFLFVWIRVHSWFKFFRLQTIIVLPVL
jgi:hypothetical protein